MEKSMKISVMLSDTAGLITACAHSSYENAYEINYEYAKFKITEKIASVTLYSLIRLYTLISS